MDASTPNFKPDTSQTFLIPAQRTTDATVLAQASGKPRLDWTPRVLQAWLILPEVGAVSYVQLHIRGADYHPSVGEHFAMCDIETRPAYRGKGYALELRQTLEKAAGLDIYSSGNMTPEGWKAFGKHVQVLPGSETIGTPGACFNSMGFVASWADRVPRNMNSEIQYTDEQYDAVWKLSELGIFRSLDEKEILWVED